MSGEISPREIMMRSANKGRSHGVHMEKKKCSERTQKRKDGAARLSYTEIFIY